jgi:hypothetical protein
MRLRRFPAVIALLTLGVPLAWTEDYTGPKPPMKDLLYLVHADNLVPTETGEAKQESKRDDSTYSMPGATSPARTPLAEPIFLIQSDKISPDTLELYKFDVKGGRREVSVKRRGGHAYHLSVTRLERGLYRVEAADVLDDGEYVITPAGSNQVFCFEVY